MDGIEQKSGLCASEYAHAADAGHERRPRVVAEKQQPSGLLLRYTAAFIKLRDGLRSGGISADKPQHERGGACAAEMKNRAHQSP